MDESSRLNRRQFLGRAGGFALGSAAAALSLPGLMAAEELKGRKAPWLDEQTGPYAPFRMALHTYSLRNLEFQKAIDAAYDMKLNLIEVWPGHLPLDLPESQFRLRLKAMRYNMLARVAYGVVEFTKDHDKNRKIFEFAKKLNIFALTANPAPDSFESLDKLCQQFQIAVAIHNHGPEDKVYGTPELLEKAIKDHHWLVGLCLDTGHFMRCGVKPVDVAKAFKGRVHAVHLKDMKPKDGKFEDVILGAGDLDLVAFLKTLKETGFKGGLALEYEAEPDNPLPSIQKCFEAVEAAVKKL